MKQLHLFYAFFKVGMLGYGGGPSSIPLVHKEVVDHYKWMDDDEFSDVLALANTLPGPIATKLGGYIGYRVGGIFGMVNAILSTIIPTILLMIVLLKSITTFKHLQWVSGMTKAVVPVVGVMLAVLTWEFLVNAKKGLGWIKTIIFSAVSLLLLQFLNINPGILIAILIAIALLQKGDRSKKKEKEGSISA
ncbi:chromate transporter [Neobacillus sp. SM06]|uniref:chromate transporter n=1 Tax=Neobacillus sp. SM06 TaxID=3422492 RepID=UPI003D2CCBBF